MQKLFIYSIIFILIPITYIQANKLLYKDRGNRFEGIKSKPISSNKPDFELLSAIINFKEKTEKIPDTLNLKFYLNELNDVFITVREIEYKYNYWMDKIKRKDPWSKGFNNIFSWSATPVLNYLKRLKMYNLGILIRLNKSHPDDIEKIAPAVFYYQSYPKNANGYLFILKPNRPSQIEYSIYKNEEDIPIEKKIIPYQNLNRPFTIKCLSNNEPDGLYKIIIKGRVINTNKEYNKIILFYHKAIIN